MMSLYRTNGKNALFTVMNKSNNVKIFDNYADKLSNSNELEYKQIILEIITRVNEGYKLKEVVKMLSSKFDILYDSYSCYISCHINRYNIVLSLYHVS